MSKQKILIDNLTVNNNISNLDIITDFMKKNVETALIQQNYNYYFSFNKDKTNFGDNIINIDFYSFN